VRDFSFLFHDLHGDEEEEEERNRSAHAHAHEDAHADGGGETGAKQEIRHKSYARWRP